MAKQPDYGAAGILGMLTPQANTTVEPEFWSLLPPDWSMVNARLTSRKQTIEDRLVDYAEHFVSVAGEFANAPITALAVGCTGASYLIGKEREDAILSELAARHKVPCFTAASAVIAALEALGVTRIALVSPYPGALDEACPPYWESRGYEVVAKTGPKAQADSFHPIYAMPGAGALASLEDLEDTECPAIVMLGTGMPTLAPILAVRGWRGPVPISCNLALAWAAVRAGEGRALDRSSLLDWIAGGHWATRYKTLFPSIRIERVIPA